jgi:signal transduction histidine kinase
MWANKAAAAAFGNAITKLTKQHCYKICCDSRSPCEKCPAMRSFLSGKAEHTQISNHRGRLLDIRAFPIKDESGKVKNVIEVSSDITEKRNLEAEATRTRHLASLGELAAGVAHEINNPINNIINYAQILLDEYEKEKRDTGIVERIIKDGDRIAIIVRSLLSFARLRTEEKVYVKLHEILSDTLSLINSQINKEGIKLKVDIPPNLPELIVHPQQIQQVFLNLISNSRFALNQKYPGDHKDKILKINCDKAIIDGVPHVIITFHDWGTGIPDHILDKVVDPFFSTKSSIMGTGLGLSISHGIISEHGGKLLIDSVEGEFTNIIIQIPVSE